jgi:hypothetical protein
MLKSTVNEHRYSSLEFTLYISYNHIVQKNYFEVISKRVLIIFAPEQAEIFKNYLFILA